MLPLIYYMLSNETRFKKNIAVGVTFPEQGRNNDEVQTRLKQFKHQVAMRSILLFLAAIPCVFIKNMWTMITIWTIWLECLVLLNGVLYIHCNCDLKRIKSKNGWYMHGENIVTIDTETIPNVKTISSRWFAVPALVSLVPILRDRELWMVYFIFALMVLLYGLAYRYLYRNRSETVNEEKDLTMILTQVRKYNWSKIWIFLSWWTAGYSLVFSIWIYNPAIVRILTFIFTLFICIFNILLEIKTRDIQEKLTKNIGKTPYVDEDDRWIGGLFYYNPNDSHLIVNRRIGLNTTVNLARTGGKIIAGLVIGLFILMPFGIQAMNVYYQDPIRIEVKDTEISAHQGLTTYAVPIEDVSSVEILNRLPDRLIKVNGTNVDRLLKGQFQSNHTKMTLLLDPESKAFIKIVDTDGMTYVFGDAQIDIKAIEKQIIQKRSIDL